MWSLTLPRITAGIQQHAIYAQLLNMIIIILKTLAMIVLAAALHSPRFKTLPIWVITFFLIGVPFKWLITASSESQTLTRNQSVLRRGGVWR